MHPHTHTPHHIPSWHTVIIQSQSAHTSHIPHTYLTHTSHTSHTPHYKTHLTHTSHSHFATPTLTGTAVSRRTVHVHHRSDNEGEASGQQKTTQHYQRIWDQCWAGVCVCVCARACVVCACVHVCMCVCAWVLQRGRTMSWSAITRYELCEFSLQKGTHTGPFECLYTPLGHSLVTRMSTPENPLRFDSEISDATPFLMHKWVWGQ